MRKAGGFGADHEQGHIREALSRSLALEHVGVIAEARRRAPGHLLPQDFDRAVAERHVVIPIHLHAVGGLDHVGLSALSSARTSSTLFHGMSMTSPVRLAVRIRNSSARLAAESIVRNFATNAGTSCQRMAAWMVPARNALASLLVELGLGLLPELGLEPSRPRRRVRSAVVRLARVVEHGLDPAAQSPGRLRL